MKKFINLFFLQGLLSVISGVLITKMSFIGRIGIHTAYREYLIFRNWWKTALVLFAIQLVIISLLSICNRFASVKTTRIVSFILLTIGIVGLYFTYIDFTTTSHKLMKGNFHSGFYLFWAGWFISCFSFLLSKKKKTLPEKETKILSTEKNTTIEEDTIISNE